MHWLQFSVFSEPFQSGWKSNSTALSMVWTRAGGSAQLFISAKLSALSFRTHSRRSCSMNRWNRISPCLNFATCSASGIKSKPFKKFLRSICYSRLPDQKALSSFWLTLCLSPWLIGLYTAYETFKNGYVLEKETKLASGASDIQILLILVGAVLRTPLIPEGNKAPCFTPVISVGLGYKISCELQPNFKCSV